MTDSHVTDEDPVSGPQRTKVRSRGRVVIVTGAIVVGLVAVALIVSAITPRPYALVFRGLIGLIPSSVTLGPYSDKGADVTVGDPVSIPVDRAPNARLTVYSPGGMDDIDKPIVLLVHGGGWMVGEAAQIGDYARILASEGFIVANLDYSLAPEHQYPTPIRQTAAALEYLYVHANEFGGDPSKMFIGGNSAGAQIASQIGSMVTNTVLQDDVGVAVDVPAESLRGVILYSGPYDFDVVDKTGFPAFRTYAWSYLGTKDYENDARLDELSVARNATADYPATYMTAGDADPLESQTYELDAVLRALGVDVTSRYWTGSGLELPHDYVFDLTTEAAQAAFTDTVEFIAQHSE
jgi:acetyl esterase